MAYKKNLFDLKDSNFGLPGHNQFSKLVLLDSVIAKSKTVTIVKYRIVERGKGGYKN